MKVDISYHVCSSVHCSSPLSADCGSVQNQLGLWGGGSGVDPLSVMGQGHTMGALCQICWGCTAVGRGATLISKSMFTGVCHVWKLIRPLTFPSHNHLRIYISSLGNKSCRKKNIAQNWLWLSRENYSPVLLTTDADNISVYVIVSPLYQR